MFHRLRFISLAMLSCLGMVAPLSAQEQKGAERLVLRGANAWPVRAVLFTPDGKTLIAANGEGVIRLWDATSGKEKLVLKGHTDRILSLSLTADGKRLASAGGGGRKAGKPLPGEVRIWDLDAGKELHQFKGHTAEVNCVSFSRDGTLLASGADDQTIKLWDPTTGMERDTLKGHVGEVNALAISPDGKMLVSAGQDQTVRTWDLPAGKARQVLKGHGGQVYSLALAPDGKTLASVDRPRFGDAMLKIWDLASGKERGSFADRLNEEIGGGFVAVAFRPDGQTVATAQRDWTVQLRDATTGQDWHIFQGFATAVIAVAFSPDGNTLATGHDDGSVRLWDVPAAKGPPLPLWNSSTETVNALAFHPNGKTLAAFGEYSDAGVRLFDLATGQLARSFKGQDKDRVPDLYAIAFADQGKLLFAASSISFEEGPIIVRAWDVQTGKVQSTLRVNWYGSAVSADGKTLAVGVDLWDVATAKPIRLGNAPLVGGETIRCVTLTPDGKTLVAGTGSDKFRGKLAGVVLVGGTGKKDKWLVLKGHEQNVHTVVVTPDGKTVASASWDRTVRVWDVATGKTQHILKSEERTSAYPQALAFTPDGTALAVALADDIKGWWGTSVSPGEVRLWDIKTGKVLAQLPHYRSVHSVAVSPDGTALAAGAYGRIRMWDLKRLLRPSQGPTPK